MQVTEYKVWIPKWGCQVTNLITEKGIYNSIPEFCKILGIVEARQQKDQLLSRLSTQRYMEELPFSTLRGKQPRWCIHQTALGHWLGMINENRIRAEFRAGLVEFQVDIIEAGRRNMPDDATGSGIILYVAERFGASHEPINTDDEGEDEE